MFHRPASSQRLSQSLSQVLDDIGVNNEIVQRRRHIVLTEESIKTLAENLQGNDVTTYHFGSRTEGTTTPGLNPDSDTLASDNRFRIIQDLAEWRQGYSNLLMVRDTNTPPGYCMLQKTYDNVPKLLDQSPGDDSHVYNLGRVLMRNDWFVKDIPEGGIKHGPSLSRSGRPGFADDDLVHAYSCKSWPIEARAWTETRTGYWPSAELKQQAKNDGCFVVPVGCRGTENMELQWRISTSLTERKLMFSLNIIQIRCYILMKMILKFYEFLNSENALSSFICKTVLLHCIEKEEESIWQDDNLLGCLKICLLFLYNSILEEDCPHFIIRGNNLLAKRIPAVIKPQILAAIQNIIESDGRALMDIHIDDLGRRLSSQLHIDPTSYTIIIQHPSALDNRKNISGNLLYCFMSSLYNSIGMTLNKVTHEPTEIVVQTLTSSLEKLTSNYLESCQTACELLSPFLYMSLGSVKASTCISENMDIPQDTLTMLQHMSAHDFSSNLKQASVFYCKGDMEQALIVLDQIKGEYNLETLQSVCSCFQTRDRGTPRFNFREVSVEGDIKHVLKHTALCVRYLPSEVNCVPEELKHEYFRSKIINCGREHREQEDYWMNWAVVDSIPFFYFLQYKVYSNHGITGQQQAALVKLEQAIKNDHNLGHKETAFNLLAQCMEQENKLDKALEFYTSSSDLRATNNAANSLESQLLHRISNT